MVQSKEQYSFVYTVTRDMIQNKKKIPIAYSTSKEDHALSDRMLFVPLFYLFFFYYNNDCWQTIVCYLFLFFLYFFYCNNQ